MVIGAHPIGGFWGLGASSMCALPFVCEPLFQVCRARCKGSVQCVWPYQQWYCFQLFVVANLVMSERVCAFQHKKKCRKVINATWMRMVSDVIKTNVQSFAREVLILLRRRNTSPDQSRCVRKPSPRKEQPFDLVQLQDFCYFFAVDVSYSSIVTGVLQYALPAIRESLKSLSPGSRVGILTFHSELHFYNIKTTRKSPEMFIVADTDDPFLPVPPDDLLACPSDPKGLSMLESVLDLIFKRFSAPTSKA